MSKQKQNYLYLTGEDGLYDTTFPTSPKGEKGVPGTFGADGQKGHRGEKGSAGQNGNYGQVVGSFSNGDPSTLPKNGTIPVGWDGPNEPPAPFDVEIGECLIDTRDQNLWVYTPGSNSTNWTNVGDLGVVKGERGTKGDLGDKGVKGAPGLPGTNGANGTKGDKGAPSTKGEPGSKGQKGQTIKGEDGLKGSAGTKGQKGEAGTDGTNGTDGTDGTKGQKGADGQKGQQGTLGLQGVKGQKGSVNVVGLPRVAVSFSGTGAININNSFNVASVESPVGSDPGVYRVNFAQSLGNSNYIVIASELGSPLVSVSTVDRQPGFITVSCISTDGTNTPTNSTSVNIVIYQFS